jgi:hypothetical protein
MQFRVPTGHPTMNGKSLLTLISLVGLIGLAVGIGAGVFGEAMWKSFSTGVSTLG